MFSLYKAQEPVLDPRISLNIYCPPDDVQHANVDDETKPPSKLKWHRFADLSPGQRRELGDGRGVILELAVPSTTSTYKINVPRDLLRFISRYCVASSSLNIEDTVHLPADFGPPESLLKLILWAKYNVTSRRPIPIAIPPNPYAAVQSLLTAAKLGVEEAKEHIYARLLSHIQHGGYALDLASAIAHHLPYCENPTEPLYNALIASLTSMVVKQKGFASPENMRAFRSFMKLHPRLWDVIRGTAEFRHAAKKLGQTMKNDRTSDAALFHADALDDTPLLDAETPVKFKLRPLGKRIPPSLEPLSLRRPDVTRHASYEHDPRNFVAGRGVQQTEKMAREIAITQQRADEGLARIAVIAMRSGTGFKLVKGGPLWHEMLVKEGYPVDDDDGEDGL